MNKQSKVLLKQASYYIKKAEFEKQSVNFSKAVVKGIEGLKGLLGRGKGAKPAAAPKTPPQSIRESPMQPGMPYFSLNPSDQRFADQYFGAVADKYRWSNWSDVKYDGSRYDWERTANERMHDLIKRYKALPSNSWFKRPGQIPLYEEYHPMIPGSVPQESQNMFKAYAAELLSARRQYLQSRLDELRNHPNFNKAVMYKGEQIKAPGEWLKEEQSLMDKLRGYDEYADYPITAPSPFERLYEPLYHRDTKIEYPDYEGMRKAFQTDGAPSQPLTPAQRGQGTLDEGINWLRNQK